MLRYISADYIFPISSSPLKDGVVVVDDNGVIRDVLPYSNELLNQTIEKHSGIICPSFINTHCHLELSHLKGKVDEKLGMASFIKNLLAIRSTEKAETIKDAIYRAEKEMLESGIVAVGDISNNDSTIEQKNKMKLQYHTFLEVFDINPARANETFNNVLNTAEKFKASNLPTSITPHAPYSVSNNLFKLIAEHAVQNNTILSYHNQESMAESELFINKSGSLASLFIKMGIDISSISTTGLNSLQSTLSNFSPANKTLLVHNTYTSKEDIKWATNYFKNKSQPLRNANLFWCFCPNANLYIENKLPEFQDFIDAGATCTIGTDSLASNHVLSVFDELKVISNKAPQIPLQTLLTWATLNGATFLNFDKKLGSIEKGKRPGLNLISAIDLNTLRITSESKIKKLA